MRSKIRAGVFAKRRAPLRGFRFPFAADSTTLPFLAQSHRAAIGPRPSRRLAICLAVACTVAVIAPLSAQSGLAPEERRTRQAADPHLGSIGPAADIIPGLDGLGVDGFGAHAPSEGIYLPSLRMAALRAAVLINRLSRPAQPATD